MTITKIEATLYTLLWAFAIYVVAQKITTPVEPTAKPAVSGKLTAKQVQMGVRK